MGERDEARFRIVLTGATGFIGRHLQRELLDAGHALTVVVRPSSAHRDAVEPAARVHYSELDDLDGLRPVLCEADFAIYGAGAVRGRDADDFDQANIAGVGCFARAAVEVMSRPRVVLLSSLAASRPCLSDYAASKRAGEDALTAGAGLEWAILRPPAVYGPGDREMLPLFTAVRHGLAPRLGPRGQRLALLHVADLVRAVRLVIEHFEACRGHTFELDDGHTKGYDWSEIVAHARGRLPVALVPVPRLVLAAIAWVNLLLARVFGYLPMLTPGKVNELSASCWLCDNQPLSAATGWRPQIALGDGVNAMFAPTTHE
ncbi:MAG: NAD-dependent epimerase/dehydratase family protein [Gammaproteobacteria bacterium]